MRAELEKKLVLLSIQEIIYTNTSKECSGFSYKNEVRSGAVPFRTRIIILKTCVFGPVHDRCDFYHTPAPPG